MRRKEKEIINKKEIEDILQEAQICRVAFCENNTPYIVPMNFGYKDNCLYFHCAKTGKKIDILKKNNNVCFEVDIKYDIKNTGVPCHWSTKYTSVIGFGKGFFIEDLKEKQQALHIIVNHYAPGTNYDYPEKSLRDVGIILIRITQMTGKRSA